MKNLDNIVVVIGSMALQHHVPDIGRKPVDSDYIMTYNTFEEYVEDCKKFDQVPPRYYPIDSGKKYVCKRVNIDGSNRIDEIEIAWPGSTAEELMQLLEQDDVTDVFDLTPYNAKCHAKQFWFPGLDVLYTLKMSHRYLKNSPHFEKTRNDILKMRALGAEIAYPKWFKRREKETYDYSHPVLNVKKNDFFKDETFYKYDHDDIHQAVKYFDVPAYTKILVPGEQVKCSEELFKLLPYNWKIACSLEEVMVLSLERGMIPNDFNVSPYTMYKIAAQKVATSITSGWFREFCWENYDTILGAYDSDLKLGINYVTKFTQALRGGLMRRFKYDIE